MSKDEQPPKASYGKQLRDKAASLLAFAETAQTNPTLSALQLTLRVPPCWQSAGLVVFCVGFEFAVFRVFSPFFVIDCATFCAAIPFATQEQRVSWSKPIETTENRILSTHLVVLAS
jgi:hypothetical protein